MRSKAVHFLDFEMQEHQAETFLLVLAFIVTESFGIVMDIFFKGFASLIGVISLLDKFSFLLLNPSSKPAQSVLFSKVFPLRGVSLS
jgi:hypothetical protein